MPPDDNIELDPAKVLAIVQQENPEVYKSAIRLAVIQHQNEVIAALRERLDPEQVPG